MNEQAQVRTPIPVACGRAWELVLRWPGLRGEDKLAWLYLSERSRGGLEIVVTNAAEVAAAQGTGSDAGRKRLKNLADEGLIRIVQHDRATGGHLVEILDPESVARGRPVKWDGQREFGFCEDGEASFGGPADDARTGVLSFPRPTQELRATAEAPAEAPALPRSPLLSEPSDRFEDLSGPLPFGTVHRRETFEGAEGLTGSGSAGASAGGIPAASPDGAEIRRLAQMIERRQAENPQARPNERHLGQVAADRCKALPMLTASQDEQQRATVEQLIRLIKSRVADEKLRDSPCLKVAWAIVEGGVPRAQLDGLLNSLDRARNTDEPDKKLRCPPSAYFMAGAKKMFGRYGLDWERGQRER